MGHTPSEFVEESFPSKIYEAIRHDSPGFTRERYSLHKPVRLLRNGEQGYVKCPHERGWPLAFANCVKLRIRGNAWKWAGVMGDSPWLIRELEDESFPSATHRRDQTAPDWGSAMKQA
ncbi:hypothetical protein GCM10009424_29750 [Sphingomonas ursincola]